MQKVKLIFGRYVWTVWHEYRMVFRWVNLTPFNLGCKLPNFFVREWTKFKPNEKLIPTCH